MTVKTDDEVALMTMHLVEAEGRRRYLPLIASLVAGVVCWTAVSMIFRVREPWDADEYWTVAYPLALLLTAVLGFAFPARAWTASAIFIFAQLIVVIVRSEMGPLIGVGLLILGLLSVPAGMTALAGAYLRRRFG